MRLSWSDKRICYFDCLIIRSLDLSIILDLCNSTASPFDVSALPCHSVVCLIPYCATEWCVGVNVLHCRFAVKSSLCFFSALNLACAKHENSPRIFGLQLILLTMEFYSCCPVLLLCSMPIPKLCYDLSVVFFTCFCEPNLLVSLVNPSCQMQFDLST